MRRIITSICPLAVRGATRPLLRCARLLLAYGLALPACTGHSPTGLPPEIPGALRVLFVGNSLTYVNDLPRTVADLAASTGARPCYCVTVAFPDYALVDHLAQGDAASVLKSHEFDFVVMQQGPSALPDSRVLLVQGVLGFAPLIARAKARPAMLSVWPFDSRRFDFPGVLASYRAAATTIDGGMLLPAGAAWLDAWGADSTLSLYAADGVHPSPMGTYLAALVVFQRLYDRSPVGVQGVARVGGGTQPWPAALVRLLQEAAASANAREGMP